MTETYNKQSLSLYLFSICCFYFLMPSMGIMVPTMALLAQAFPNVSFISITYITTIVSLFQIIGALIGGAAVGRFLKFRTTLIVAFILYLVGGIFPYFFSDGTSWTNVLIFRAIFGLGLGLNVPMGATLLTRLYSDEIQRAKMLGFGMLFFNIGAFLFSYIGPLLGKISWQTAFLGHFIGIIGLIGAILLKEPPDSDEVKKEKVKITPRAILWPLIFAVDMTLIYSIFTMGSMVLANGGMDPNQAGLYQGIGISLLTIIGIPMSIGFGWIYKALNKWVVAGSLIFIAFGLYLVGISGGSVSVAMFLTGWVLAGIGQQGVTLGLPMVVSTVVDKATASTALGLTFAAMNMGGFLSTPWSQVLASTVGATSPAAVLKTNAVVFLIFTVIMVVATVKMEKSTSSDVAA